MQVIENVTGQPFDKYMEGQFRDMGLANTYLDRYSTGAVNYLCMCIMCM